MGKIQKLQACIMLIILISLNSTTTGCGSKPEVVTHESTDISKNIKQQPETSGNGIIGVDFSNAEDNVTLINSEPIPKIQKFKGANVTVATPPGRMADFLYKDGQEWARRTGAKLTILELPFNELFEQVATDIVSGNGSYDVILYPHYLSGEIMGTGKLVPLEKLMDMTKVNNSYQQGGIEWDYNLAHHKEIYSWYNGHVYSLSIDGDVFQVAYRKDLWIKYAKEFKERYGYELKPDDPQFPETWDQYYDIAEFFNGKEGLYGTVDINARSRTSTWHFLTRYFSYLQKEGMYYGDVYFDKETLKPLINNPAGVKAMEDVIKSASPRYSPVGAINFGWDEMQKAWQQGKTAIQFTWPQMLNVARRPGSMIPGGVKSTGYSMIPGSKIVFDADKGQWVKLDTIHRASPLAHGWQFSIIDTAKSQKAAFDLLRWMVTGDRLRHDSQKVYWEYAPSKTWEWEDPLIAEQFKDAPTYMSSLALSQEVGIPDLRIPGAVQMYDAIEIYKKRALEGAMSAKQAVDAIAADWEKIVKQRGFERMKKAYNDTIKRHHLSEFK
jgi:multiple sugar transport system substrate-binding protein